MTTFYEYALGTIVLVATGPCNNINKCISTDTPAVLRATNTQNVYLHHETRFIVNIITVLRVALNMAGLSVDIINVDFI